MRAVVILFVLLPLLLAFPARASAETLGEELGLVGYLITYDLAGGTVAGTNPGSYTAEGPAITLLNPTREAYEFLGWSGTGLVGRANTSVTIRVGSSGNRSYTANWVPTHYNLSYRLGGGVDRGNPESYTVETPTFSLVAPAREGYDFVGWTGSGISGGATEDVSVELGSTGDRAFAANWSAVTYTISYDLDGGSASGNPGSYTVETLSFSLAAPERAGYDFVGWSGTGLDDGSSVDVRIERGSTGHRSYTAHWEPATYTVRYDVNADGDRTASVVPTLQEKGYQTVLGTLPTPVWPGHRFDGWFTQAEGGERVGATTTMGAADLTCYAHWTAEPHSVAFVGEGGAVVGASSASGLCGDAVDPPSATRDGYAFVGWYTAAEGGVRVTDWRIPATDSTYHAHWWAYEATDFPYSDGRQSFTAPVTGTYRLEVWGAQGGYRSSAAMGGLGGYSFGEVDLRRGETLYVYVGGSGQHYGWNGGGARVSMSSGGGATDMRLGSTSLYARLIVAGGGGSDGAENMAGGFGGGAQGGDGIGEHGTGGQGATMETYGAGSPHSQPTVAAFGQGGASVRGNNGYGGAGGGGWYGGAGVYPDESGDNDRGGGGGSGYVWTQESSSLYPPGCMLDAAHYLRNADTVAGNMPFASPQGRQEEGHAGDGYARVTLVSYSGSSVVAWDANGGAIEGEGERLAFVETGSSLGQLPEPEREGHLFVGWYTEADGGSRISGGEVPVGNSAYFAHWSQVSSGSESGEGTHSLTFDAAGGMVGGAASLTLLVAEGDSLDELPAPSHEADSAGAYIFTGWYTKRQGGARTTKAEPDGDETYFAHWAHLVESGATQAGHHAITLVANAVDASIGDRDEATLLVPSGDTITELPKPSRENYLFSGWYTKDEGGARVASVTPGGSATYFAHWSLVATADFSFSKLGRNVGTFAAPIAGTYLLEAWGADGGSMIGVETFPTVVGGKGGYSRGTVTLAKGEELSVVVGEAGYYLDHETAIEAAWNGGGGAQRNTENVWYRATGGGATHFASETVGDGQLAGYANSRGSIVLVAGGGGGAAGSRYAGKTTDGGAGGGQNGVTVTYNNGESRYTAVGGGQSSGGAGFGKGNISANGSGGGGWYGGGRNNLAGAGGSGRVGGLDCAFDDDGTTATGHFVYGSDTREISGGSWQGDLAGVPDRPDDGTDAVGSVEGESGRGAGGYARVMLVTPSEGRAITLDAQGGAVEGSSAVTLLVDAGEAFGDLPDASREGYEFAGWYTSTSGGARVTADASTASGEVTYYARWSNSLFVTHSVSVVASGAGFARVEADRSDGTLGDVVEVEIDLLAGYDPSQVRANGTVVPLEERDGGGWLWRYTVGDDDIALTLTTIPITYTIAYELPDGATAEREDPTTYTVESGSIALGGAVSGSAPFLGWYTPAGERVDTVAHGSTGDLELRAFFDVDLYDVVVPAPYGQAGGTLGIEDVSVEGAAAGRASVGSSVTITVKAQIGWRVTGWAVTRTGDGGTLGEGALQTTTGTSGGVATATIVGMPASAVDVAVDLGKVAIRQTVAVRYEMPDGTWNTDPDGDGAGVASVTAGAGEPAFYAVHHTADVLYGETYSPMVVETAVYQAASGETYEVTDERVTYLDVPRKVASVAFRYRLQDPNSGDYGAWVGGSVVEGVRVGESVDWDTAKTGLNAAVWDHVSGTGSVAAAATATSQPAAVTVSLELPRRTYTLTVDHDGHFPTVSGGGTYRAGQSGIPILATPEAGRYFVFWDGDIGPASSDGTVGGLDDPEAPSTTYTMGASDAVIAAESRGVRYTTLFDGNGGMLGFESYAAQYNEVFPAPGASRVGYAFAGWDIVGMDAGEHTLYVDGGAPTVTRATSLSGAVATGFKNLRTTPGTVVSLTATWSPATYRVAFEGVGATSGEMAPQLHVYDAALALSASAFRRETYDFVGWATSEERAAQGLVDYTDGQEVSNVCADPAPDGSTTVTLWAVWAEVAHDVRLLAPDGALTWAGSLWEGSEPPAPQGWGHRRLVGWSAGSSIVGLPGETLADVLARLRGDG